MKNSDRLEVENIIMSHAFKNPTKVYQIIRLIDEIQNRPDTPSVKCSPTNLFNCGFTEFLDAFFPDIPFFGPILDMKNEIENSDDEVLTFWEHHQIGTSSLLALYALWDMHNTLKYGSVPDSYVTVFLSHNTSAAVHLRDKVMGYYNQLPSNKIVIKHYTKSEITFNWGVRFEFDTPYFKIGKYHGIKIKNLLVDNIDWSNNPHAYLNILPQCSLECSRVIKVTTTE